MVGPWLSGWYTARVWTCLGHMEWGLARGVGACQIFVLGEETEVCHLSLPVRRRLLNISLPPPITNCVQILGGAWILLPSRQGIDGANLMQIVCGQLQQLSLRVHSHVMFRSQHPPPPWAFSVSFSAFCNVL